jgi:hypothetical protein
MSHLNIGLTFLIKTTLKTLVLKTSNLPFWALPKNLFRLRSKNLNFEKSQIALLGIA